MATPNSNYEPPIDLDHARQWCINLLKLEADNLADHVKQYPLHTRTSVLELASPRSVITVDKTQLVPLALAFGAVYAEALSLIVSLLVEIKPIKRQLYTLSVYDDGSGNDPDAFLASRYNITIVDGFATKTTTKPLRRLKHQYYVDLAHWYCLCRSWHQQIGIDDNDDIVPITTPWGRTKTYPSMPTCGHLVAVLVAHDNYDVYRHAQDSNSP